MLTWKMILATCLQVAGPPEKPASSEDSLWKTALKRVELGGQVRFRAEYRNPVAYANLPSSREDDDIYLSRIRLNLGLHVTDQIRVFVQPQDQRVFGEEASLVSDENNLDVHQGYVEIRRLGTEPLSLRIGRQELLYGDERLVSPLDWHNVGRTWDGAKIRYAPGRWWVESFWTVVKEGTGAEDDQDFYGVYASCRAVEDHEFDLFALGRRFNDNAFTAEDGSLGDWRDVTAGTRLKGQSLPLDYSFEGAYQTGRYSRDELSAWAVAAVVGLTLEVPGRPRLAVEYTFATGDEDPNDGRRETFDPLFPFQHYFQGFADIFAFKNGHDVAVYARVIPVENVSLHLDVHQFWLEERRDAWYAAAGTPIRRDPSGGAGDHVGYEVDLHARVKIDDHLKFWGGWSHFFAGPYVRKTPGPDRDMDWLFVQMTVDF